MASPQSHEPTVFDDNETRTVRPSSEPAEFSEDTDPQLLRQQQRHEEAAAANRREPMHDCHSAESQPPLQDDLNAVPQSTTTNDGSEQLKPGGNPNTAEVAYESSDSDVYQRARQMQSEEDREKNSRFCCQLGITMKRILILQSREPVSLVCELIIPIIFVVGSIILWKIFKNDYHAEETYFDVSAAQSLSQAMASVLGILCYDINVEGYVAVPGIQECSALVGMNLGSGNGEVTVDDFYCTLPTTGTPVGLCVVGALAMQMYQVMVNMVPYQMVQVPTLDQLIPLQWAMRLLYDNYGLSTVNGKTLGSAIFSTGALRFAPDTAETGDLVNYLKSSSVYFQYVYNSTTSAQDAEDAVKQRRSHDPPNWGIVQVNSLAKDNFDVDIRLNATALPSTKIALAKKYVGGIVEDGGSLYILSGFTTLQQTIYAYYLKQVMGTDAPADELFVLPEPTIAYRDQQFLAYGGQFVPLIVVLGFLYPVSQMTKRIVLEKELRLREAMLIMGLSEAVMYTAWFIIYVVQYLVVSLIIAILMKVTYTPHSDFGILFFLMFFFCLSIISLSGLIAVFFNKARLSSILSPLIYFVLAIPLFAMQDSTAGARTGVSFLSPSGLSVGLSLVFDHELAGGTRSSDVNYFRDKPSLLIVMIILFCDFVLYLILMLYLDAVLPKEWGTRKHPLFFILDPINSCRKKKEHHENLEDGRAPDGVFEEAAVDDSGCAIRIVGLNKVYKRGGKKFTAVNNFHWGMREGEISVLLGHNGAGKTTTMNMMTGMVSADDGDCYIYGRSVRHELAKARQEIGYCPQHNILWPYMTCREHLWYYASVKGLRGDARDAAINMMLEGVDLMDKADYKSKNLSGGQKRKLSVAVAFVGGSRLIFLDEPTAGMDVGARRHTWGLLREMSSHHSILLTTHFMDEADLLGDTVAIMSRGRLQCAGSNMFLKSKLGVGYVITMSVVAHVDRVAVAALVQGHIPAATALGCGAGEVAFRLPMSAKSTFPELLRDIEEKGESVGINAYSISATTLEEIFIEIAEKAEVEEEMRIKKEKEEAKRKKEEKKNKKKKKSKGTEVNSDVTSAEEASHINIDNDYSNGAAPAETKEGEEVPPPSDVWNVQQMEKDSQLLYSQFKAMMWKRLWNALRDRRTQFFQIVCPVLCVLLAMLLMLVKIFQTPTITLSGDMFGVAVNVDVAACANVMDLNKKFSSQSTPYEPPGVSDTQSMADYLLDTYKNHDPERYTGMVCTDSALPSSGASLLYNSSAIHGPGLATADLYNGYYMKAVGSSSSATMVTKVNCMPQTKAEKDVSDAVYALMIAIIIMIPFTFIPSTFVSWIVKERECKARHLQNVSGAFFSVYWFSNFLFDIACYIITIILVIIVFLIFNRQEYIGKAAVGATIVLFLLYGLAGVAMAYAVSFAFKEHSTAQNVVMLGNFIAGFLLVLCVSMLSLIDSTKNVANALRWVFRIVPAYCVGEGISNLATLKMEQAYGTTKTPWSMDVIGWPCVYMAIEVPVYVFVTLFVDHPGRRQRAQRLFHNPDGEPELIEDEDVDVIAEREAVLNDPARESDLVRVEQLRKVYPNGKVAVRNITFGVTPGEVFGFLGTNGAGKTTTISILCQEYYPTSGHGAICGNDIVKKSREALRCIGYCPQFDATIDLLSVREHLELYAGVRGIAYDQRKRVVEGLMRLCELKEYENTLSHALSGGNRRKLSVALSLIGGPRVVFLDEPSAGMDPVARRGLWNAIETVADNCSIVLTTHHLEEVEALAHRVAIMVDGSLQCIGNKTHLKHKYGSGFEVTVRIAADTDVIKNGVKQFFEENFEGSKVREYRARRFTYELPSDVKLSDTFKLMEENADDLQITDYNVSQTSIEQVFLQISEEAERKEEEEQQRRITEKKEKKRCGC